MNAIRPTLDLSRFPSARNRVRGEFRAVQAELLPQSGERVTIAVVAKINQAWHAFATPNLDQLSCVYGSTASLFKEAADQIVAEINAENFQNQSMDFEGINLPLGNLSWSSWIRTTAGHDTDDAMQAAIGQASSLAAFYLSAARKISSAHLADLKKIPAMAQRGSESLGKKDVVKQILSGLEQKAPNLARFMRARRPDAPIDAPDFIGGRAAAEFSVLRHRRLTRDLPEVQASLWRLDAFRSGQRTGIAFVYTDAPSDGGQYGEILHRAVEQAHVRGLRLVPHSETDRMVSELVQAEAA